MATQEITIEADYLTGKNSYSRSCASEQECKVCKTVKPLDSFGLKKRRATGRNSICKPCANQQQRQKRENRLKHRHCRDCGLDLGIGARRSACYGCAKSAWWRTSIKHENRQKAGVCIQCGITPPVAARQSCEECLARMRANAKRIHQNRRAAGLCIYCGTVAMVRRFNIRLKTQANPETCETCYLKAVARRHLGNSRHWNLLKEKWEAQNQRCPYTGILLELGYNASLDHIKPAQRFPLIKNEISNLEWVHDNINSYKSSLTKDEFIALMRFILKRVDSV